MGASGCQRLRVQLTPARPPVTNIAAYPIHDVPPATAVGGCVAGSLRQTDNANTETKGSKTNNTRVSIEHDQQSADQGREARRLHHQALVVHAGVGGHQGMRAGKQPDLHHGCMPEITSSRPCTCTSASR